MTDKEETFTHESYGMVGFSRVTTTRIMTAGVAALTGEQMEPPALEGKET